MDNKLPFISLVESGGANLNYQAEIFVDGGRTFANMARMSAMGIPHITVVHGSSTAGGAYLPGLSDYVVVVQRALQDLPRRPAAAQGRDRRDRHRRGAGRRRDARHGVGRRRIPGRGRRRRAPHRARDHGALPWNERLPPLPRKAAKEPRYDPDELCGVVPVDYRKPYDVREVIARLVDDSDFLDFKALYGAQTVCGQAAIEGEAVGIIGNNGPIDAEGSVKAAQFIQLCGQADTPIVYLQNTTGYMVGREAERAGIVKHGSKMIQAVANATVPKITLLIGASFGAGNYGMCGRAYDPRFIFAWPNSRIAVMGAEQAAGVLAIVTEDKLKRDGKPVDQKKLDGMKAA